MTYPIELTKEKNINCLPIDSSCELWGDIRQGQGYACICQPQTVLAKPQAFPPKRDCDQNIQDSMHGGCTMEPRATEDTPCKKQAT